MYWIVVSMMRNILVLILLLFLLIDQVPISAQILPEPPSPEEDWYPNHFLGAVYDAYSVSVTSAGTSGSIPTPSSLVLEIVDRNGKVRREVYGDEKFNLRFDTPFDSFYLFLYEWYPPGNVPKGHWLIWGL